MRVLAFDPGAARMGWAVISREDDESEPVYLGSGVLRNPRNDGEGYQEYRLRLIDQQVREIKDLYATYTVGDIVNEIVPPSTSTAFASNGVQAQLAATAVTVVHCMALYHGHPIHQVSATTVKKAIGGNRSASKVKVRDGVFSFFPDLRDLKWKEWVRTHDESDACAIALTVLNYSV